MNVKPMKSIVLDEKHSYGDSNITQLWLRDHASDVLSKLQEAECEAALTNARYSAQEVLESVSAELGAV